MGEGSSVGGSGCVSSGVGVYFREGGSFSIAYSFKVNSFRGGGWRYELGVYKKNFFLLNIKV